MDYGLRKYWKNIGKILGLFSKPANISGRGRK
jgi:hypothetical protein